MSNRGPRHRVMLFLAGLSVAGILSMHGLDPVVATVDQGHASHAQAEARVADHGAAGLCIFVAAVAAVGLAAIKRLHSTEALAKLVWRPGQFTFTHPVMTSGPPLLHRLCVLRL